GAWTERRRGTPLLGLLNGYPEVRQRNQPRVESRETRTRGIRKAVPADHGERPASEPESHRSDQVERLLVVLRQAAVVATGQSQVAYAGHRRRQCDAVRNKLVRAYERSQVHARITSSGSGGSNRLGATTTTR